MKINFIAQQNKPAQSHELIDELLVDWGVRCAVTKELIPIRKLRYWDVDKQQCYKSALVVPANKQQADIQLAKMSVEERKMYA